MPLTSHGFSIRDYTSKMRSVDVFNCWPFPAAAVTRNQAESWLPPMTLPNSRRFSAELARPRSNLTATGEDEGTGNQPDQAVSDENKSVEKDKLVGFVAEDEKEGAKVEMICSVCRDFNAVTLTAVNAHIDGCLREERRRMRRSKSKVSKKRSIAEIFELKEDDLEEEKLPSSSSKIETVLNCSLLHEGEVSITVAKFRWLSERLKALRSNRISFQSEKSVEGNMNLAEEEEKSEILCPVCRVFNAATEAAVNVHIDGCLATTAIKDERCRKPSLNNPKAKMQKKRSLVDILTVAPQINAAGNGKLAVVAEKEDGGEVNIEEFEKCGFSSARIKSKKSTKSNVRKKKKLKKVIMKKTKNKFEKRGVSSLDDENKKMNKRMKKKKQRNLKKEFTAEKEDAYKRKMQNPVTSFRKLGTAGNKKVKLNDNDVSSAPEKKLGLNILSEEKKEKLKNWEQRAVSPIRGILKNHKHVSESNSSGSDIQDCTEESHCDVEVPSSDRNVRISAEDYVLGSKKRNSFDETVFDLPSDALASSFGKEQSTGNVEGTVNLENDRNENIAINTDKRKEVCPVVEIQQFSNTLGQVAEKFFKPCTIQEKSNNLVEKSESESLSNVTICDNNLQRVDRGNTTAMHFVSQADASRSLSAFQGWQNCSINTQVCESEAFSYTRKFIDQLGDPTFQSRDVHSNANTRTFLDPSPSCSVASCNEVNERPEFPLHTYENNVNNGQALGGRSSWRTFSADKIGNSILLPGWGERSIRGNCMEQNFYGLPLNSHGELINFDSSGKAGMNQPDKSCTLRGSLNGVPVNNVLHQNENLSIGKRHAVQKTLQDQVNCLFPHYSGRLGVRELHGRERADIYQHNSDWCSNHYVQPLDSELTLMRNPFIEQNQHDKVPNHKEYGMVSPSSSQPTMRLMGKDVPIGRSSKEKQQFEGGVLWAEEESRRRHYSIDPAKDNSLLGRCSMPDWPSVSQLQIQTENELQLVKNQNNHALQGSLLMKGPNSEFLNLQSGHISQTGCIGTSRNISTNFHPISKAPTSYAIYNRAHEGLPHQFISGAKPQGHFLHSLISSSPCNVNQSTPRNGELNDWKKHQHVTFEFPFLNPIVEEQAKSSWFKRSYRSFPPWSLGSAYENLPGGTPCAIFPQNASRNSVTIPSVNHSADALYSPNFVTSHCPRKALLCSTPIAHPHTPHASVSTVTKPPSSIDGFRNIFRATDRVKLDYTNMTVRENHPCINSRKRLAVGLVDSEKPNKLPNIEMQKNFGRVTALAQDTSSSNLLQNTGEVELDLRVGERSESYQNEAQNLNPRSYIGFDSFDQGGGVISGPVKLSPDAKHILKPSQNQDNSIPIHSAIPIAVNTDFGRDLELQEKLTKMYIF